MGRPTDEQQLIDAALGGNVGALGSLFERHDDGLRRFVYGLTSDRERMSDLMQDTYLKACRSLSSYRRDASFRTWLHRIAYNTAIDQGRRHAPDPHDDQFFDATSSGTVRLDDAAATRIDVAEALRHLPDRQRVAVLLVDGHGFDYQQAAEVIGINASTVGVHVHRGRDALRRAVGGLDA